MTPGPSGHQDGCIEQSNTFDQSCEHWMHFDSWCHCLHVEFLWELLTATSLENNDYESRVNAYDNDRYFTLKVLGREQL